MSGTRKEVDPLSSLVSQPEASRPEPPRAPTPAELAKILAKAAAAKAAANRPAAPPPRSAPAAAAAPPPRPAGIAGAPPPKRSMSAAEAMEAARKAEEEHLAAQARAAEARAAAPAPAPAPAKVAAPAAPAPAPAAPAAPAPEAHTRPAPTPKTALTDPVQALVSSTLPGTTLYVAGAWYATDRKVLTALWKAHRANFAARLQLDLAVTSASVIAALQSAPAQKLVAAHVLGDKGDWLLWVDLQNRQLLAAFPNARSLVAGLDGA